MLNAKPDLFRPRWSKVFSDLWDSKLRTLLVVASITVGVFAIGMIATAYAILAEDINLSYAAVNPFNVDITTDPFDEEFVRIFEDFPGVEDVEGRQMIGIRTSLDGINWQTQNLTAVEDFETVKINQLVTLDGTQYPNQGELVVSKDFMTDTGYQVGDQIYVKFPNGETRLMPLVGHVADQARSMDGARGASAYVTLDTLERFEQPKYFNHLYLTIQGDGSDENEITELAAQVEDKVQRNQRNVYRLETKVSDKHPMVSMLLAIFGVLGALGVLITILSSTLIINTLNALLTQQMRQIGVIKLVGGRSYQILGMYLLLIFAYGVIALIIAIPSGAAAGYGFASFIAYMMNVELQGFRAIPFAILLQVVIAFLIPLGAGFFPVNRGSKTNVRRAISNDRTQGQPSRLVWLNQIAAWIPWISRPITAARSGGPYFFGPFRRGFRRPTREMKVERR